MNRMSKNHLIKFVPSKFNYVVRKLLRNEETTKFPAFNYFPIVDSDDGSYKRHTALVRITESWSDGKAFDEDSDGYSKGDILYVRLNGCPVVTIGGRDCYIIESLDILGKLEHDEKLDDDDEEEKEEL